MKRIADFLKTLNRSKLVNGVGAFFALAIPVLIVVGQNLPPSWKVTLLVASAVGVLSRAQYIFQKVVPLLDGSSVVQVKPPASGQVPALLSVATNVSDVVKPGAAAPSAPTSTPSADDDRTPVLMTRKPPTQ